MFRSAPPRRGRPRRSRSCASMASFRSTRAPAQGATTDLPREGATVPHRQLGAHPFFVSIRAPRAGATHRCPALISPPATRCFDPRPRAGATTSTVVHPEPGMLFYDPRPREGATAPQSHRPQARRRFDPRPREGATSSRPPASRQTGYGFDPRPRAGGDWTLRYARARADHKVSIRALAKRATAARAFDGC